MLTTLSVCLSVCLSQSIIVSKRLEELSCCVALEHHSTYPTLCFEEIQVRQSKGLRGAEMDMGWVHPWVGLGRIFQHM